MKTDFEIHGGNIAKEARELGVSRENIIDASASIVPFKLPKKIIKYLVNCLNNGSIKIILIEVILK